MCELWSHPLADADLQIFFYFVGQSSPDGYPPLSPLFSTIELLIPLGAEFNALSPHKL